MDTYVRRVDLGGMATQYGDDSNIYKLLGVYIQSNAV